MSIQNNTQSQLTNKDNNYINVMKYLWCKHFKLSDFPACCRNCKNRTCDEDQHKNKYQR